MDKTPPPTEKMLKQARMAKALRENLLKRKQQQRQRTQSELDQKPEPEPGADSK